MSNVRPVPVNAGISPMQPNPMFMTAPAAAPAGFSATSTPYSPAMTSQFSGLTYRQPLNLNMTMSTSTSTPSGLSYGCGPNLSSQMTQNTPGQQVVYFCFSGYKICAIVLLFFGVLLSFDRTPLVFLYLTPL